jgi:integrase
MDKKIALVEEISLKLLNLDSANEFTIYLTSKFAKSSLGSLYRTCLNPCINQAIKQGLIKDNPYSHMPLPRIQKNTIECFEPNEVKAIIAAFYSDAYLPKKSAYPHSYYAPMIEFLALTGCRPEECHALTWDDIKYKGNKVFITFNKAYSNGLLLPFTKTHTIRLFPCNNQLKKFIASIPKIENPNNLIFPSVTLGYVSQGNFRNIYWSKVLKGLVKDGKVHKYLKQYCLRHSFITRLIREGVDIATVAALSGNSVEVIYYY